VTTLLVDAGGLFGRRNREEKMQTEFLCEVTGSLGYDAIGLGEKDLNYGLPFLRKMMENYDLPFTSANVRDPGTGELILPEYLIVERRDVRFGIASVMDPQQKIITMTSRDADFEVADPVVTMNELVPRLREEVDIVILLSHLGDRYTETLLKEVSGIDLVVIGRTFRNLKTERIIENTVALAAVHEGRYIGRADIQIAPDLDLKNKIKGVSVTVTSLDNAIDDDPTVAEQVAAYKRSVEEYRLAQRAQFPRDQGSLEEEFLGEDSCKKCHQTAFETYARSAHASAFTPLRGKGMNFEPECLSCHTTGYQFHNGYDEGQGRNRLTNVQCEACHSYGTQHERSGKWAAQAENSCLQCHDLSNSPHADDGYEFDYATYWEKIAH